MSASKEQLRSIVLDIILGREKVTYSPTQFASLTAAVAEVLSRRQSGEKFSASVFPMSQRLPEDEWELVQEIFWDLVCERVISPGLNSANPDYPWFRVHADAAARLQPSDR